MDQDSGADKRKSEPVISKAIQALLDRHGVPERKRLGALEAAAGMGYQQVRRRMTGETPWNVDEIQRLASHFGEPVFKLLGALVDDAGQPAVLQIGSVKLQCSIWPGDPVDRDKGIGPLVAVPGDGPEQWLVLPLADAGDRPIREIKRLIFEAAAPRRVAVVDDDDDLTTAIVQFLRKNGLEAISYNKAEHLRAALETTSFDGYILDWLLDDSDARDLLPLIRAKNPNAPLIILTGQIRTGQAQEEELASTIAAFRAQLYEKPTRALSLFNALELGFEAASRSPS
jgi:CheY-like chemotaxis protein